MQIEYKSQFSFPENRETVLISYQKLQNKTERYKVFNHLSDVVYTNTGKPILEHGLHLSVSHTVNQQIMVLSLDCCGIDIEALDRTINTSVLKKFDIQPTTALEYWTESEAYTKLTQIGLYKVLKKDFALYGKIYKYTLHAQNILGCLLTKNKINKIIFINNHWPIELVASSLIHTHINI